MSVSPPLTGSQFGAVSSHHVASAGELAAQYVRFPNNPLIAAAFSAIMKGGTKAGVLQDGWTAADDGSPEYHWQQARHGAIRVYFAPTGDGAARRFQPSDGWHLVSQLSAFTCNVAIVVLAAFVTPDTQDRTKYPKQASLRINAGTILGMINIRRWGAERRSLCERIAREMRLLQDLRFELIDYPVWDPISGRWNKKGVSVRDIQLFDCLPTGPSEGEQARSSAKPDVDFNLRIGDWSQWWLNSRGKVWLCYLNTAIAQFDHRYNRGPAVFAKKLGLHATLLWAATRPDNNLVRRVDRLLADIGESVADPQRSNHWAGRTRDRLDDALMLLRENGVLEDVNWQYGFDPGGLDRQKGWVSKWLGSKVSFRISEPAETAAKRPPTRSPQRRHQARNLQAAMTSQSAQGQAIRETRVALGIAQSDLADKFGVSPGYLSQIENDHRQPSCDLAQKIGAWLATSASS